MRTLLIRQGDIEWCRVCRENKTGFCIAVRWGINQRDIIGAVCKDCLAAIHAITSPLSILVQTGADTKSET